jgi:glycine dehydrogenase subunit 2
MIEPTESESRQVLEDFAAALVSIAGEAQNDPDLVRNAPHITPVGRLDEVLAARNPVLKHRENAR